MASTQSTVERTGHRWTGRQREVLDLLARGRTNAQIADDLGVSLDGAKWHVREIMAELDAPTREDAAEYWRAYNGLPSRFSRLAHGLVGLNFIRGAALAAGAAAAVGIAVAVTFVTFGGDDDAADTPSSTGTPVPTTTAGAGAGRGYTVKVGDTVYSIASSFGVPVTTLRAANPQRDLDVLQLGEELHVPRTGTRVTQCDPTELSLTMRQERTAGYLLLQLDAATMAPCLLEHPLDLRVVDATGQPLALITNPVRVGTDLQLPASPIVRLEWSFWCGAMAGYRLGVSVGDAKASFPIDGAPACDESVSISKLTVLSRTDSPPSPTPTPTPAPEALERLYSVGDTVEVQVYAATTVSGTPLCVDIIRDMVPSSLAPTAVGSVTARCSMASGQRLHFVRDRQGRLFLDGVELLLIAKYTLLQNYAAASCNAIRSHLIPASEPADVAAYLLVCDVPILPPGQSGEPLRIWARVRPDLLGGATIGLDARCWELSRYLGGAGGSRRHPCSAGSTREDCRGRASFEPRRSRPVSRRGRD